MVKDWKHRASRIGVPLLQIAAIVLIGLVYFLGIRSERTGFVRDVIDPGFRKLSDPVLNVFRGKPPPVATIALELDTAAHDSLLALQKQAVHTGRVPRDGNSVFAGMLHLEGRKIPVVVALRSGTSKPGQTKHWPLHVRALPGDTVRGMQTFDLTPVMDSAPLWSFLLNAVLHDQGHATLGQALAEVELNGRTIGLCMLQGRPDATMLYRWSRGSGPVLRFDDGMLQSANEEMAQRIYPSTPPAQGDWLSAPLLLQAAEGARLSRRAQKAIRRMEAFRAGDVPASAVFDVQQTARLLALCDLLGTQSALDWWNLRFLVDSVSEVLVPIPLHGTMHQPIASIHGSDLPEVGSISTPGREMTDRFLADTAIHARYMAYLDTFSRAGWWENTRDRTVANWGAARQVVNAEFPRIDLDLRSIDHDRTVIRQTLAPTDLILAYMRDAEDQPDGIALANVHSLPVDVIALVMDHGDTIALPAATRLIPRKKDRPLHYIILPLSILHAEGTPKAVLIRLAPSLPLRSIPIRSWSTFGAN